MSDVTTLAAQLARRVPLDPDQTDPDGRRAAAAEAMRRAGDALAPQTRSPKGVLSALEALEQLAQLEAGELTRPWLAVRALDLKAGEVVGGEDAAQPAAAACIELAGAHVAADADERAHGLVGDPGTRTPESLAARARRVTLRPLTVATATATLFTEPAARAAGPHDLQRALARLAGRHGARMQGAAPVTSGVPALTYRAIERANGEGDDLFNSWKPSLEIPGAHDHPTPLVESTALAATARPPVTYQPLIPQRLIDGGALSRMQLEEIVYAGQAHGDYLPSDPMEPNAAPPRRGYLLGAGTGAGKTRINMGVILDNFNQGRRKAVLITERHRLIGDAAREWTALGGRQDDLIDLKEIGPQQNIPQRDGILFMTYGLLRGEGRIDQLVDWLGVAADGVLVFDECHNCRHALSRKAGIGEAKRSQQGKALLQLQAELPNARVVYSTATSAGDIVAMGYAVRLGLWGRGTAFANYEQFFEQMTEGGMNALELVARDLKAMGLYSAPNLSFEGVVYERLEHALTPEQIAMQDALADAWRKVNVHVQRALAATGLAGANAGTGSMLMAKDAGKAQRAYVYAQFRMARARFFQAFLSGIKTRPVIDQIVQDLANGHQAIVQMTNTYAANAERAIAEDTTGDMDNVEATPRDILMNYVREQFPVVVHRPVRKNNKVVMEAVTDANGAPVTSRAAEAARDQLLDDLEALEIPEGPLEQILKAFGAEQVAEVTGRGQRLVPGAHGKRVLEERTSAQVDEDIRAFQAGVKKILVFSASGAAGANYHADARAGSTALRRHYLLQAGWRADQAIQSLGRSHRAGQAQPPVHILVTTDLWTDRRMISTVAAGMQALGAITRGQRHAASQELFSEEDNLESDLATEAWTRFLADLEAGRVPNLSLATFEHETGLTVRQWGTNRLANRLPELKRFLNAMAGMTKARMDAFGAAYSQRLDEVRLEAIRDGRYDRGIETIRPESLIKLEETVVHRCQRTGAQTKLCKMLRSDPVDPVDFQDALRIATRKGNAQFVKSALTGRVACLVFPRNLGKGIGPDDAVEVITPHGQKTRTRHEVLSDRWTLLAPHAAEQIWEAEQLQVSDDEDTVFYCVTGTLLPLWDRLPRDNATVYQMMTDTGERLLGRVMPEAWVSQFVARVQAGGPQAVDPDETLARLEMGELATLANAWVLEGRPGSRPGSAGEILLTVAGEPSASYRAELEAMGLTARACPMRRGEFVFKLPAEPKARKAAFRKLVDSRPVVGVTSLAAAA